MTLIRNLYDWVLKWSESKYGPIALGLMAFAEASFFPIPPDVLLIALALGMRTKSIQYGLICSIGSVLGAVCGYAIGSFLWWNGIGEFSKNGENISVNLKDQIIISHNSIFKFNIDSFRKHCLLNGLDDIGMTMEKSNLIDNYEKKINNKSWNIPDTQNTNL